MEKVWKSLTFIGFLILAIKLSGSTGAILKLPGETQNAIPGEVKQSNEESVDEADLERKVREDTEGHEVKKIESEDEADLERNIREDTEGHETDKDDSDDKADLERNVREDAEGLGIKKYESDDEIDHSPYKRGTPETGKPDNAIDDYLMHIFNFGTKHTLGTLTLFGIPNLDPIKIPDVDFGKSHFLGEAAGFAKNIQITGLGGLGLNNLHTSLDNKSLHFELGVPQVAVSGIYNLSGHVLYVIPLHGDGDFKISVDDIHFHFGGNMSFGEPFKITLDVCKVAIKEIKANFANLMGNGSLGNKLNDALGTLGTKLFNLIEPPVCSIIRSTLEELLNKAMSGIKIPDSVKGLFNGAMSVVNKIRSVGRKKRSIETEGTFKIGMLPYLYPKDREKIIQDGSWK